MEFLASNESSVRLAVFLGTLVFMVFLESVMPKKARTMPRTKRWVTNFSLVAIDALAVRILTPAAAVGVAVWSANHGVGLLNLVDLGWLLEAIIAFLVLDLAIYVQHVVFHKVPMLWALHSVHHVDRDIDATTGIRFHPVEIVMSMLIKMLLVLLLGPAAVVVILFEVVLNAAAIFNHSNLALPKSLDRVLRAIIVTPDFHRVHHSVIQSETDSNYGFFLSLWDKVFGTYVAQPRDEHDGMIIGLAEYQTDQPGQLGWSLLLPWIKSRTPAEVRSSD